MEVKYFKIFVLLLAGILAFIVFKSLRNIFIRFEKATKSEEDIEEEISGKDYAKAITPMYFVKKIGNKTNEISSYLKKYGLSQKDIYNIASDLYNKGFGTFSDNERYIYSVIRSLPSLSVVSLVSYSSKIKYGLSLDELIARNLNYTETSAILKILSKKPEK